MKESNGKSQKEKRQMSKSEPIVLNMGLCDWITVTSFEDGFYQQFVESQGYKKSRGEIDGWYEKKIMQYSGVEKLLCPGSVFAGAGFQGTRVHNMVRVTGAAADLLCVDAMRVNESFKVSRLDFQVTVRQPEKWSQWKFFNRMKRAGATVGWAESVDAHSLQKMETVYIGSRYSERFVRLYNKVDDNGVKLLRFEVEYKGARADVVGKKMNRAKEKTVYIEGCLLHEVQGMKDKSLSLIFENVLAVTAIREKVSVAKSRDKTKAWLIGQVLTAFKRYISDHDDDGEVAMLFMDTIQKVKGWQ